MARLIGAPRVWVPTPASPTFSIPRIGVMPGASYSVQVTNNTLGELWLTDSGVPPVSRQDATFVIHPRMTANVPMNGDGLGATWSGLVSGTNDVITFIFSDEIVTPTYYPGVLPAGNDTSPVQTISSADFGSAQLVALTTLSGLNIGNVFVYNPSSILLLVQVANPTTHTVSVRPYSWVCFPANVSSGQVSVNAGASGPNLLRSMLQDDTFNIAWTDINYTSILPVGAGSLPNPLRDSGASIIAQFPAKQIMAQANMSGGGNITLYTLPVWNGIGPATRIVLSYCSLSLVAGAAGSVAIIRATNGFDGLSAGVEADLLTIGGNSSAMALERNDPIAIANFSTTTTNIIQFGTAGSITRADAQIGGYQAW